MGSGRPRTLRAGCAVAVAIVALACGACSKEGTAALTTGEPSVSPAPIVSATPSPTATPSA